MRVLLLSDTYSEHTEKWALSLANQGIEIGLFSFNKASYKWYKNVANITLLFESEFSIKGFGLKEKLSYFKYLPILKSKINYFKPDILHAHYATSYGLIGALSKFKPFVISVWGSDVFDFPRKNSLNKYILKYILRKATIICSTSNCMKKETEAYTQKKIAVIPFGINIDKFNRNENELLFRYNTITIGNIKPLEAKYGIDILITVFCELVTFYPDKKINLVLIGEGSEQKKYEQLVTSLNINHLVTFTGRIPHNEIHNHHKKIDIFISLSVLDSESFGVSLVEAMSSSSIVIASDVAGFNEVLGSNNSCGYLIPKSSSKDCLLALMKIIDNPSEAINKSKLARKRAIELYNWEDNVQQMLEVYKQVI